MSGGYFETRHSQMRLLAEDLEHFVSKQKLYKSENFNHNLPQGDWDHELSIETLDRIRTAAAAVEKSAAMFKLVDYLLSGDNSEQSFNELWEQKGF